MYFLVNIDVNDIVEYVGIGSSEKFINYCCDC